MPDIFDFVATDGGTFTPETGEPSFDDGRTVTAPTYFVAVLGAELALSALCILPGTKVLHVVGYIIAAVLVAATVVTFRSADRVRRRSTSYVSYSWPGTAMMVGLVAGLALAMIHAYYFAQSRQIAP